MTVLDYLNDPANAARHRQWKELEAAKNKARISARRAKRIAGQQANLEAAMRIRTLYPTMPGADVLKLSRKHALKKHKKKSAPKKSQSPNPPIEFTRWPSYKSGMRAEEFYRTREWLELRYTTIRRYQAQCMCCGATETRMHVDHIKPRSRFPELELDPENMQVLCEACNIGKSNKDHTDWRTKGSITQTG